MNSMASFIRGVLVCLLSLSTSYVLADYCYKCTDNYSGDPLLAQTSDQPVYLNSLYSGCASGSSNCKPALHETNFTLVMQTDGNLVLQDAVDASVPFASQTWHVNYPGPYYFLLKSNGLLVIQTGSPSTWGASIWSSTIASGTLTAPYCGLLQWDRNFVVYDSGCNVVWTMNTWKDVKPPPRPTSTSTSTSSSVAASTSTKSTSSSVSSSTTSSASVSTPSIKPTSTSSAASTSSITSPSVVSTTTSSVSVTTSKSTSISGTSTTVTSPGSSITSTKVSTSASPSVSTSPQTSVTTATSSSTSKLSTSVVTSTSLTSSQSISTTATSSKSSTSLVSSTTTIPTLTSANATTTTGTTSFKPITSISATTTKKFKPSVFPPIPSDSPAPPVISAPARLYDVAYVGRPYAGPQNAKQLSCAGSSDIAPSGSYD
ncbi:hypothetical protein HDU76_008684, partial [Blyttiomyces sp. JEL0837]